MADFFPFDEKLSQLMKNHSTDEKLSRSVAERGIYPAVDPLDSTSRIMDPNVIGAEHYGVARGVQKILQDYKSLQVGIYREHKSFGFFRDLKVHAVWN